MPILLRKLQLKSQKRTEFYSKPGINNQIIYILLPKTGITPFRNFINSSFLGPLVTPSED